MIYAGMYFLLFVSIYISCCFFIKPRNMIVDMPFSIDFVTITKGIAISIVIYGHLGNYFGIRYLTPLGGIGVVLFLFLSGYGLNESWKLCGSRNWIKKRIIGILVPYAVIESMTLRIRGGVRLFGKCVV